MFGEDKLYASSQSLFETLFSRNSLPIITIVTLNFCVQAEYWFFHLFHQSSDLRHGCQDGNLVQGKMGATSENNAASNHSSDYVACDQKNKDYSEKGSDAQVSALTPSSISVSDNTMVLFFFFETVNEFNVFILMRGTYNIHSNYMWRFFALLLLSLLFVI